MCIYITACLIFQKKILLETKSFLNVHIGVRVDHMVRSMEIADLELKTNE